MEKSFKKFKENYTKDIAKILKVDPTMAHIVEYLYKTGYSSATLDISEFIVNNN